MEITLEATNRDKTGSAESRRLRSTGFIPAVMYGLGSEPESLLINAREFNNALKTEAGSNVILNVNFGKDSIPACLLYTSPSPRDRQKSRMPSSA